MRFKTPLNQAEGLGSAKTGLHHWIVQRITAFALIPLSIWFVGLFVILIAAPYNIAFQQFTGLWSVALATSFIFLIFYHGALGIQVIWEDYISHEFTKWILIVVTKILSVLMALLAILSVLKIFLS